MALSLQNPSLPSGKPLNVAKTVVKDSATAGYMVGVFILGATAVGALYALARRKGLIPSAGAAGTEVKSWFGA